MTSRLGIAGLLVIAVGVMVVSAWPLVSWAQTADLERGAYLATIARCKSCHSPAGGTSFSGGRVTYDGEIFNTPNLTSHATGLATWTDEQIRQAITVGHTPDGRQLYPVMPYRYYNNMADDDVVAIIGFLRDLDPVENPVSRNDLPDIVLPDPPEERTGLVAPDRVDMIAYGEYLTTAILACGACHTPQPSGSEPDPEIYLYLAGGQAFEGEWGVVYAGNLTADIETGLAAWREEEIILAVMTGARPEGRQMLVMPWEDYSVLASDDIHAVIAYLRSLPAIDNPVPLAELNEGYARYADDDIPTRASPLMVSLAGLTIILLLGLGILMTVRQYRQARQIRDMDWGQILFPGQEPREPDSESTTPPEK